MGGVLRRLDCARLTLRVHTASLQFLPATCHSACAWHTLWGHLIVVTSSYFDDFVLVDCDVTTNTATIIAEALLSLLGWDYDREGPKYRDFGSSAVVLGASISIRQGAIVAGNTPDRLQQVEEQTLR
eukprot:848607-Amphidinium_carterae.1